MSKIRILRTTDIPQLLALSGQAGWNQTAADWERLLALAPDGCFGIEAGGRVVSTTTAIRYANELAWIGMVLTDKDHRNQGNAKALLEHAIKHLRQHNVAWAKLDATSEGRPIYAKLGFVDECQMERWKRPAGKGAKPTVSLRLSPYIVDPSFDRAYFSAYRIPLLNALLKDGSMFLPGFGYAMARPGALASYFGPSVVRTRDAARMLIEWFLATHHDTDSFWDLFPDNKDAVQLAIDYGFEPARQLTRMTMRLSAGATEIRQNNASVFAIAGFEYG